MSQPDLIAQLREARPVAPSELLERVRLIAVEAGVPPRRRVTWRRSAILVLAAVAVAIIAGLAFFSGGKTKSAIPVVLAPAERTAAEATRTSDNAAPIGGPVLAVIPSFVKRADIPRIVHTPQAIAAGGALKASTPAPSDDRAQTYEATLTLRLPTSNAISKATTRALEIAESLGGYPQTVRVNAATKDGAAYIVLKVPRDRVQDAVRRLGALGTIVGENVSIEDLQVGVDQNARLIARLQGKLTALHAQPETDLVKAQIASVTQRIETLQRSTASTIRAAEYATVELELGTPPKPVPPAEEDDGPLHGLGIAFHWIGIGAVYALALGVPVLALLALGFFLARGARRRREDRLLATQ